MGTDALDDYIEITEWWAESDVWDGNVVIFSNEGDAEEFRYDHEQDKPHIYANPYDSPITIRKVVRRTKDSEIHRFFGRSPHRIKNDEAQGRRYVK